MELPPNNYRNIIEELAVLIHNPVQKLAVINKSIKIYHSIPSVYRLWPMLAESAFRKMILDNAENNCPGSIEDAGASFKNKATAPMGMFLWRLYKYRNLVLSTILITFAYIIFLAMPQIIETISSTFPVKSISSRTNKRPSSEDQPYIGLGEEDEFREEAYGDKNKVKLIKEYLDDAIWLVEKTKEFEIYSNGLHVITTHTVESEPRRYYKFSKKSASLPGKEKKTDKIAGILYHASESDLFPLRPEMDSSLKRTSMALIKYCKRTKCYNYFIDRFGRVYRIVKDGHAADHAGNGVWMDNKSYYLNISHAFIGICFEGKGFDKVEDPETTRKLEVKSTNILKVRSPSINEMQLLSGMELTDWLRVQYQIPQRNCVTHGLTSVNPKKMLIGYHLDLSHGFPFNRFKLSNKYREPLPAITDFGFTYDDYFLAIFDGKPWPGIHLSDNLLAHNAKKTKLSFKKYRAQLNKKFLKYYEWQKEQEEKQNNKLKSVKRKVKKVRK